ncbi:MAG: hypothetical protein R2684_16920 [Pyrinomonadaceae bacterium]
MHSIPLNFQSQEENTLSIGLILRGFCGKTCGKDVAILFSTIVENTITGLPATQAQIRHFPDRKFESVYA